MFLDMVQNIRYVLVLTRDHDYPTEHIFLSKHPLYFLNISSPFSEQNDSKSMSHPNTHPSIDDTVYESIRNFPTTSPSDNISGLISDDLTHGLADDPKQEPSDAQRKEDNNNLMKDADDFKIEDVNENVVSDEAAQALVAVTIAGALNDSNVGNGQESNITGPRSESASLEKDQNHDNNNNVSKQSENTNSFGIFLDDDCGSMNFYLHLNVQNQSRLSDLIRNFGGREVKSINFPGAIILTDDTSIANNSFRYYRTSFIYDSINSNEKKNLEDYRIIPLSNYGAPNSKHSTNNSGRKSNQSPLSAPLPDQIAAAAVAQAQAQGHLAGSAASHTSGDYNESPHSATPGKRRCKNIFTPEEDSFILQMVRYEPEKRYSHDFYRALVDKLPRHTAASIRDRYRRVLDKKLEWVYQNGMNGDFTKVPIPTRTLKQKFTPEDDYELCLYLVQHSNRARSLNFFQEYANQNGRHSGNSYRYRFRKVIAPKGVENIIKEYRERVENGEITVVNTGNNNNVDLNLANSIASEDAEVAAKAVGIALNAHNQQDIEKNEDDDYDNDLNDNIQTDSPSTSRRKRNSSGSSGLDRSYKSRKMDSDNDNVNVIDEALLNSGRDIDESTSTIPSLKEIDQVDTVLKDNDIYAKVITAVQNISSVEKIISSLVESLGISERIAQEALHSTSAQLYLLPAYFDILIRTGEPPADIAGVFNTEDDKYITSNDEELWKIVIKRHGEGRVQLRKQFLDVMESEGQEQA